MDGLEYGLHSNIRKPKPNERPYNADARARRCIYYMFFSQRKCLAADYSTRDHVECQRVPTLVGLQEGTDRSSLFP